MRERSGKSVTYWSWRIFWAVSTKALFASRARVTPIADLPEPVGASIITKRLPAAKASRAASIASRCPFRQELDGTADVVTRQAPTGPPGRGPATGQVPGSVGHQTRRRGRP